ncbi:MAG: Glu-tRNA(Gln) amidotransferase subunit GatD [Candidatus Micrarchaeota archaeon]
MYSKNIDDCLKRLGIGVGDRIRVGKDEGILMPRPEAGDGGCIVLKLDSGYNVGIVYGGDLKVERLGGKVELENFPSKEIGFSGKKPMVAVLSTGGTVTSRIDYRTGGVIPAFSAKDLVSTIPELAEVADVRGSAIMNVLSGNMRPEHYKLMAGAVSKEIEDGASGVVILHGTDTMHYTAAALSFMLQNLSVPVVLVGAQRSSDRGSSDAAMNLICGVNFAANADYSGVVVCMHGSLEDKVCQVHKGTRVRKMHTSRRDAFKSIDVKPVASVDYTNGKVEFSGEHPKRRNEKLEVASALEEKVGLLKIFPGMAPEYIRIFVDGKYRGVVLEGTGLGHMPTADDENSDGNKQLAEELSKLINSGCIVVMTSQCIYGDINMNVYGYGRDLQKNGVIPGGGMLPEVAYVKLKWLIGNYGPEKAKELISSDLAGEIVERREVVADFERGS